MESMMTEQYLNLEPVNLSPTEVRLRCVELLMEKLSSSTMAPHEKVIPELLKAAANLADFVLNDKLPR